MSAADVVPHQFRRVYFLLNQTVLSWKLDRWGSCHYTLGPPPVVGRLFGRRNVSDVTPEVQDSVRATWYGNRPIAVQGHYIPKSDVVIRSLEWIMDFMTEITKHAIRHLGSRKNAMATGDNSRGLHCRPPAGLHCPDCYRTLPQVSLVTSLDLCLIRPRLSLPNFKYKPLFQGAIHSKVRAVSDLLAPVVSWLVVVAF